MGGNDGEEVSGIGWIWCNGRPSWAGVPPNTQSTEWMENHQSNIIGDPTRGWLKEDALRIRVFFFFGWDHVESWWETEPNPVSVGSSVIVMQTAWVKDTIYTHEMMMMPAGEREAKKNTTLPQHYQLVCDRRYVLRVVYQTFTVHIHIVELGPDEIHT